MSCVGNFPQMENIAAFKPVSISPPRSTCGVPERSSYCQLPSSQANLLTCYQAFCIQECPYRSSTPPYAPLGTCVTEDSHDTHPGTETGTTTITDGCLVSPPSQRLGAMGSLTLALWIKPSSPGEISGGRLVFSVTVSEQAVTLHYIQSRSQTSLTVRFRTEGRLVLERWTHLVLQVRNLKSLEIPHGGMKDSCPDKHIIMRGSNQFIGRMQDFRFYPATLTNREIVEVYSGVLPELHVQSECRCPPSHPRVHPLVERYCIPNAVEDTTNDRVLRLNLNAHALSYVNDQDMGTTWLSKIMTTQELDEGVTITVDLANGQYQVFYVILQFGGLLPESVLIQRRRLDLTKLENGTTTEQPWLDWQYMARNCSVFGMQNNGPLPRPDSVNCLQLPSDVSFSGGNITFSLLTPQPNLRPGYNDFYNTPALQKMVHATQVRIHLSGQYHTRAAGVNQRHRYYTINEITISGRCECHGHADHCDTSVTPYRCLCLPESHTEGNNCQRCSPLYNDKPFRSGGQLQPMNCRPCHCNGHALSCHYDVQADDQPDEHYRGGGGVCDNCMHNTTGKNCELCISGFFRLEESDPTSADVCRPCSCHTAGTVNGSMACAQVGGQCQCKAAVTGRRCADCLPGWYGLKASNPNGCIRCNCSDIGVISTSTEAVSTCNQDTGQCRCKPHVTGLSCDRCEFGYWNLSHPDGCVPCDCDPMGSLSQFCEPEGGQCECKPGVGGQRCDSCGSGSYGLRLEGSCAPCNCSQEGTVPGTDCDPHTGQCVCKKHVEGHRCDSCLRGYHTLEHRNSLGCLPCACDISGTLPEGACDMQTGQCPCREGVEGAQCTNCAHNYYNRKGLSQGCVPCVCDPRGTVAGTICDSTTGQCVCIPTRYGQDCSRCRPGFYLSPDQSMCAECDCHPMGASQRGCESQTGQCVCAHPSVGGRRCDQCREMFFGFNPGLGRCQPCACDPMGSLNGSCHPDSGVCVCKLLVTGDKCDVCQPGASHFEPGNHFGCTKAPSQQPAPVGFALNYSSIHLSWHPPDSPNSNRLNYTLIRDGQSVHSIQKSFEDSGLSPYTNYSYWLITANVAGVTISASASYQTLGAPPEADQLHLNLVGRPGPTTASFIWSTPPNDTGPVERFVLSSTESSSTEPIIHYTGLSTEAVASGLKPFTQYTVILEACSSGGCTSTPPLSLLTASAPPQNQPPPRVTATGPHTLHASWEPPSQPNGVITRYEVFLRGPMELQNLSSVAVEKKVFLSSGWLDPSVSPETQLTNRSALSPPENSTIVAGLQAFSTYQMRVESINVAGRVTSGWTTARTMEGVPELMAPPEVSALTSTSLKVLWSSAEGQGVIARGQVTEYRVNLLTEQTSNPYAPPVVSQVLHRVGPSSQPVYIVKGLKPFHEYNFTVTLCTKTGCVTSLPSTGRTLPAAPTGLSPPQLYPINDTTIQIDWDPPLELNGPHPLYQVERTDVSLSDPEGPVVRGTRFPGNSYYQFPSDTLPVNTDFTGIELTFRTRSPDGLLLCAFSPGNQEEFLAVQIKNGRPYFLFDPQGSVVAVSVQGDGGRRYNDGQWHSITATRRGAVGTIVVNNQYRGSAAASSGSTIIGENMGVFIGGLPEDFTLLRKDSGNFSGCLRDVSFKMTDSVSDEWIPLDWAKAIKKEAVYENWEGCPIQTVDGAHFLGHGYLELGRDVFSGGKDFDISMDFRTDQLNALLLFTYNTQTEDYMLVELEAGLLSFILASEGHVTELSMWAGLSYCDGDWKQLSLAKRGPLISAAVNDWAEETRGVGGAVTLRVDSPLYLGGVPMELAHPALDSQSHKHGETGLTIRNDERTPPASKSVNLFVASRRSVRVYLDGCPTTESRYNCRGNDSVLVYSGRRTQVTDSSLQPFTEYLYRFVALAAGGWASGPWQRGRSRGRVPRHVPPPTSVQSLNGFSARVSWVPPTGDIRGLIDRYELKAYNSDQPEAPPIKAVYLANGNFTGVLSGLTPSTRYIVTVSACSPVGCTESRRHDSGDDNDLRSSLTTPEEGTTGKHKHTHILNTPMNRTSVSIFIHITSLGVYSTHVLLLSACTSVGCTNSSQVTVVTSQLPPGPLQAPNLTLLDSRTLLVEWSRPSQVNGALEFYSIFLSRDGARPVLVYNTSELFEDHTLRNLTPGTTYSITVAACTGGGCTLSPSSHAQTEESTPENVPAPLVTPLSPYALNVSWTPPDTPNGIITSYGLWLDGVLILNSSSSQRFVEVEGLSPWSRHILRLQACTAQGCGKGPMVEMRTLEMAPDGPILLELTNQSSRSVRARWMAPPRPNGNINLTCLSLCDSLCLLDGDGVLDGGMAAGSWLSVTDLQPYTNYSFWIRGCNTQGCVESLPLNVTTPPAAPDGLSPPTVAHVARSSLNVSWHPPAHSNAPGPLRYTLQMRTSPQRLLENATDIFSYHVEGLLPFTQYLFRVVVSHAHGQTAGPWATLRTAEDSPGPVDSPTISGLHPRSVTVTWDPPSEPNGVITNYTLYLWPSSVSHLDFKPSSVEACTSVGCSLSGMSQHFRTLPAPPEGVPAPHLYSDTPTSVLLSWGAPDWSNGPLDRWLIERRVAGTKQISTVGHLPPNSPPLSFLDSSSALSPWTTYEYRLVLHNQAGPWVSITTRPSRPAGLSPPRVKVLGSESIQVTWSPPLIPNGEIHGYEIRLPEPRIFHDSGNASELNVTVTDLIPYTDYSVTVLACSEGGGHVGGCTESLSTPATTLPASPQGLAPLSVVAVSESFLAISWQPPSRPNGPNIRYKLLRRKTHQPLAIATVPTVTTTSPPPSEDLHRWLHVYSGTKLFYQDKGLSRFTRYEYQLVVHNDVGFSSGEIVTAVTMAGVPLHPPSLSACAINHTAVQVNWTQPSLQDLQGEVESYFLKIESPKSSQILVLPPEINSTVISDLWPSATYTVSLQVSNGAHNTTKAIVNVTTEDGEPDGMSAPEVVPVDSNTVRVLWLPPLQPNGAITGYYIYVNDRLHGSVDNSSGSYLLRDLLPFTVYNVQVQVCTVYACVRSNVTQTTTVEDLPADLGTPLAQVISPRLDWSHPGRPNGIMLGYEVLRRTLRSCANGPTGATTSVEEESEGAVGLRFRCSYLQCPASHGVCGTSCFSPDIQVCCSGLLYTKKPHHHCCDSSYLSLSNSSNPVCCNGKLLPALPDHQCCGGYYVHVKTNEYCCPDHSQGRVSVGLGDSCCGGVPYAVKGGQLCCGRSLHDGYGVQCCGGRMVDDTLVCCGDAERGEVHTYTPGFICCDQDYINSSTSLCCVGKDGHPTMHPAGNATVTLQCCGSKVIHQEEECCNGIGYDPQRHVCADRPTPGLSIQVCLYVCLSLFLSLQTSNINKQEKLHFEKKCKHLKCIYHYGFKFINYRSDNPYKMYRVRGWNSFGRGASDVITVTTSEDKPWGVAPPRWSRLGERDDIIQLQWQAPARPNGDITHYVILRDGQERYRGDENSFTDVGGIRPLQEYSYQLRVCNRAGCADSTQVVAVTVQGVPEGVQPPLVTALSPSSLHVSWSEPTSPNGVIQWYHLNQTGVGTILTHTDGPRNYTVTGLQPYTDYSFVLVACTAVGCGASSPSTRRTLQAIPAGVWSWPRHLIINTSAVELYWDQPSQPNGHISQYRLNRDGHTIFTGDHRDQNYTDTGLLPNRRYVYKLEATTEGGTGVSDKYVIQTPASCPTGIPPPRNVTVSGPHSISLAWNPPGEQPVNYNILFNPGSDRAIMHRAEQDLHLTVTGLEPFTAYYIRVQACQTGEGVSVQTLEAAPEGLPPPTVKAAGANVLEVHWSPPQKPNGVITSYHIYRRPVGTEEKLLVFIWSTGPFEFFDASPALQPFSYFQYRVKAHNSKGSVLSPWALAQTLQAEPQDMAPPTATPTGAYSVHLKWSEPGRPNGLISHYRLVYKKHQQDPTLNSTAVTALTVEGSVFEATVYGLEPYSQYSLRVEAVNAAGSVSSPWVGIRTLEASPAGLANFTVEQREQGRALLLSWDQPLVPNGVITMYNLYSEGNLEFSGLSRNFLFRRLEPWTVYTLTLEACTSRGCTRSPPQHITTAAAPPASQPPPRPLFIGPDRVSLRWGPPAQPNGPIGEYFLLGRSLEEVGRGRNNEEDIERGKVLFRESSPQQTDTISYTVTGLRPWTQYEFSVRTHNPAGHTSSHWVTVTTRQAPPRGLAPPTVSHLHGRPSEVLISWTPPLEPNGVLQSYRIQRNNVSFSFSFDPTVLSYTDEDLLPFTTYSYAVIACTSEGCIISSHTNITTLEAPPATVEAPTVVTITSNSINISWSKPPTQNGEVTEYVLKLNNKEVYRGRDQNAVLSDLRPHTSYQLVLLACTSGGCTTSTTVSAITEEAPPTGLPAPTLKVTGPESVEITWRPPEHPNGIITGYELFRDGEVIYVGAERHYHDFTLLPNVEYSYIIRANNSRGAVSSATASAKTHPSAPSGVGLPTLTPLGPNQVGHSPNQSILYKKQLNHDITKVEIYLRTFIKFCLNLLLYVVCLSRYEVRVEACTALGCSSSDWSPILTLEAPPAGQTAPLLDLQPDKRTGLQTTFLLTWSPPAQPNGRVLHYEVHRRLDPTTDMHRNDAATLVYRNVSTAYEDEGLQPYTLYQYQVWAVNLAGRAGSPWASGRTGPAPPEGVGPPVFLRVSATSAVVDIHPPARSNGIVSLYRVFSLHHNNHTLLSEGTSHQQTLHGLRPYTQYWVGVEACTCYQCCSQGPVSELHTMAAPPAHQPPPRPVTLTSRSVQLDWDEPLAPNGVIERWVNNIKSSHCLQPYSTYELRAACFNNMGSTASNWTTVTTLSEAPQYVSPFSVGSNLTVIWLDWAGSFSLNGYLKEYSVTESQLRVYTGFYSYLHIPRTSQKSESTHIPNTLIHILSQMYTYHRLSKRSVYRFKPTPVYSELWFILLLALLGLFLLAILLGLVLQRYSGVIAHIKLQHAQKYHSGNMKYLICNKSVSQGLTDTKIVGSSARFSPMSVLRVPSQTDLSQVYSQHSLHRSVSQLIDRKSLMMEEGSWDNPLGHDSGLYVEEDEFVDAIKALSSAKKEHTMFTDTHL
uniref:Usherin n=1 Tax=Lates calcarifer TaxID=8187 RepID=A0A4W6FW95_LATCA